MNHGLGDNVQAGILIRHLRHHKPNDEQHVVTQVGKHLIFRHVANEVHHSPFGHVASEFTENGGPIHGKWDKIYEHPWYNPDRCYSDCPSTKATHALRETFGLPVVPDLLRYEIYVGDEARRRAERWVATNITTEKFVIIHYEGASWKDQKDLSVGHIRPLVANLLSRKITPVILNIRSPLINKNVVIGHSIHDAEEMAALMGLSSLNVVIDSGPGKIAASVAHVPCLTVWQKLHPVHFSDLDYGQVLHLIPQNHADYLRLGREQGLAYFNEHYRHKVYADLSSDLCASAMAMLDEPQDEVRRLVSKSNRWATMWPFLEKIPSGGLVVETGCMRQDNDHGAGMSSIAFGLRLQAIGGRLVSVDNDPAHVTFANSRVASLPVRIELADSAAWLRDYQGPPINAIYLDSMDVGVPGFEDHCRAEAQAAIPHLAPDAPILIDDTVREPGGWRGKGAKAVPWLMANGWEVVRHALQVLLRRSK